MLYNGWVKQIVHDFSHGQILKHMYVCMHALYYLIIFVAVYLILACGNIELTRHYLLWYVCVRYKNSSEFIRCIWDWICCM